MTWKYAWHMCRGCNGGTYCNVSWMLARMQVFIAASVAKSTETSKRFLCNLYFFLRTVESFEYSIEPIIVTETIEMSWEGSRALWEL